MAERMRRPKVEMLVRPTGALETYAEAHPEMDRDFGDMNPDDELKEDERDTGEKVTRRMRM